MGAKERWKASQSSRRAAGPPVYPLPRAEIDRRFAAMDGRAMLYFTELEIDRADFLYVLAHPSLGAVRELRIDGSGTLDDASLALLVAAPVQALEVLALSGWSLNESALATMLDAPNLRNVRELIIEGGGGHSYPALSLRLWAGLPPRFPTAARLESLTFTYECTARVAEALATHAALDGLQTLELLGSRITDATAAILAKAGHFANLRSLNLSSNQIGAAGIAALAAAPWPSLERLELVNNPLQEDGVRALAARTGLPALRELRLAAIGLPLEEIVYEAPRTDEEREQWISDNQGGKPPTEDRVEHYPPSSSEIAARYFPGQSIKIL
jgi:Leucine Rich repeat